MKVLVACERSGIVREAFRRRGHEAFSCDLSEAEEFSPFHIVGDAIAEMKHGEPWDIVVAHPPCTFLSSSGARWKYDTKHGHGERHREGQPAAISFFLKFVEFAQSSGCKMAIENPAGVMSSHFRKPDQYIEPHQFGHDARKATGLWLFGLPLLKPTKLILPSYFVTSERTGRKLPRWGNQSPCGADKRGPSEDRGVDRSRTFEGIAEAMANQWG